MKQKIIGIVLLIAMLIPSAVWAQEVPTASGDIYGWSRVDTKNEDSTLYDTVNVIEDETYGYAMEAIKQSGRISDSMLGIRQRISADKLIDGHTYVMEFYYKMEKNSAQYWVQAGFPWNNFTSPSSSNDGDKGWKKGSKEIVYAANKDGLLVQIHTANGAAHYWIADVKVYDKADESKNLLINGDFSIQYKGVENPEYNNGKLTWAVPEGMPGGLGVNIYMRDLKGVSTLLNKEPIPVENMAYTLESIPENSFYLDIFITDAGSEIKNEGCITSCRVIGAVDFMDYKFYNATGEISKIEAGKITVALPMINNIYTDGYDVELIVLLKTGDITRKISKAAYKVMPSEEMEEYTVDIDVDCDIDENTHLEIFAWDSIDGMNVLRDVYTF